MISYKPTWPKGQPSNYDTMQYWADNSKHFESVADNYKEALEKISSLYAKSRENSTYPADPIPARMAFVANAALSRAKNSVDKQG